MFVGAKLLSSVIKIEISLIQNKKIEFNDSNEIYNLFIKMEKTYNEENFEYSIQLANDFIRSTIYQLIPNKKSEFNIKDNFKEYTNIYLKDAENISEELNELCKIISKLRNNIGKGTGALKYAPKMIKEWNNIDIDKQRLIARLTIDFAKLIHNQFIVIKFGKLNSVENK